MLASTAVKEVLARWAVGLGMRFDPKSLVADACASALVAVGA